MFSICEQDFWLAFHNSGCPPKELGYMFPNYFLFFRNFILSHLSPLQIQVPAGSEKRSVCPLTPKFNINPIFYSLEFISFSSYSEVSRCICPFESLLPDIGSASAKFNTGSSTCLVFASAYEKGISKKDGVNSLTKYLFLQVCFSHSFLL